MRKVDTSSRSSGNVSRSQFSAVKPLEWLFAAMGLVGLMASPIPVRADNYTAPDGKLTFSYPRRWQADNDGQRVRLTAPDGTRYFVLRDTVAATPGDSPAANAELKARALELVKPLLKDAEFAGGQPLTMDHGLGAAFRFHGPARTDTGPATAVYLAFVGKHSIVLIPERAGQSSQSIGLAGILQSLAFTDALPRSLPQRVPRVTAPEGGTAPIAGPGTVSFASQIAPILKEKCEVCHRSAAPLGGFSVTSYADMMRGGRHGDLISAGRPESSSMLDYLTGRRELMPKGGPPLPADQIALIRKWITEGARPQIGGTAAPPGGGTDGSPATPGSGARIGANRARPGFGGVIGLEGSRTGRVPTGGSVGRLNGIASNTTAAGAQLLEGYTGHLVPNDLRFSLRLHMDKSASAVWSLAPGREVRYAGTVIGQDGNYLVTLNQTGSPPADQGKTLTIELRARGSQETGLFGLDGARPRREITELVLSESRTFDAPARTPARMRPGGRQNRR